MLTESRLSLSFASPTPTLRLSNKENTFSTSLSSHSRLRKFSDHRRRARKVVPNSHFYGPAAYRHRTRVRASRPINENVRMAAPNATLSSTWPGLILPRHLKRPRFCPIDPKAIIAVDPVLEGVPLSYILHSLKEVGPQLLEACNTTAIPPDGQLPQELQLVCHNTGAEFPSHILAVYSQVDAHVTLYPAHALVLATSCAHLPSLPPSKPAVTFASGNSIILPVIPLRIPSPATFPILLSYLYTRRADHLLTELLPIDEAHSIRYLTQEHASASSLKTLVDDVRKVHGLWSNATALGIFDDILLSTLEMVWHILLDALVIGSS